MWLYNEKKNVAQPWDSHDLNTTDGETVLKRTAIANVAYSTQTGIKLYRGHYIRESHPLSKHAFIEIVNSTKVRTYADFENASQFTSLKVLHLYKCLQIRIRTVLHRLLSISFIAFCNLISLWICRLPKRLKCTIVGIILIRSWSAVFTVNYDQARSRREILLFLYTSYEENKQYIIILLDKYNHIWIEIDFIYVIDKQ